jgi:hypothetical protein
MLAPGGLAWKSPRGCVKFHACRCDVSRESRRRLPAVTAQRVLSVS